MEQTVEQMMLKELNDWNHKFSNEKQKLIKTMWILEGCVAGGMLLISLLAMLGIATSFDNIPDALFCGAIVLAVNTGVDLIFLFAYRIYVHSMLSCLKMRRPIIDWEDVKIKKLASKY